MAKMEASHPCRYSSNTTPPGAIRSRVSRAANASALSAAIITPFPAASPSAFITRGYITLVWIYSLAPDGSVKAMLFAVGIFICRIRSLAKILLVSILAAALDGPMQAIPSLRNRSAQPSARGCSGPKNTRSGAWAEHHCTNDEGVLISTQLYSRAMPALPGATVIFSGPQFLAKQAAMACSRAPPPMISTFKFSFLVGV